MKFSQLLRSSLNPLIHPVIDFLQGGLGPVPNFMEKLRWKEENLGKDCKSSLAMAPPPNPIPIYFPLFSHFCQNRPKYLWKWLLFATLHWHFLKTPNPHYSPYIIMPILPLISRVKLNFPKIFHFSQNFSIIFQFLLSFMHVF